jgi:ADP-ribose pyrophosphatase YjhB (NUDIX family)
MRWRPQVTVAAVIEHQGKFLMVKERIDNRIVYNQPAGHLEPNETLHDAVIREVQEETARRFLPKNITGIYRMHIAEKDVTYLRVCFTGSVSEPQPGQALDEGILEAVWLDKDELLQQTVSLRSPLVLHSIEDYLSGKCYPLDLVKDIGNV